MEAAVLVLVWGRPPRVLLVRKSCSRGGRWACDVALPGGRVEAGESPVDAALREAWEEACVPGGIVRVVGVMEREYTRVGRIPITPVIAVPRGPLCPRPCSGEVDAVFWAPLGIVGEPPGRVVHPARRVVVEGYRVAGGVLWGATLRILRRLHAAIGAGEVEWTALRRLQV